MRFNSYEIMTRAIESGITCGYTRAHKHTDKPSEDQIKNEIHHAIMLELSEILCFDSDSNGENL